MFSIDQNCHSLWDVLPKLQALVRRGKRVRHFIEDIDVAFTSLGSRVDSGCLRLARERFHRSGGADWGAALFYFEFLGRQPVDIRQWDEHTGMKTSVLARKLGRSVDDLYDEFSPSDNWQLIGPSYVGDREHHRVVGDLTVEETAPFIRQMLAIARKNSMETFPQVDSRQRLGEWFDREEALVERLLKDCAGGRLVELYRRWLGEYLGDAVALELTSSLFACGADPGRTALMEVFLSDYHRAASLYNQAVEGASVGLRPLNTAEGELPFFATLKHHGRRVRALVRVEGQDIRIAERGFKLRDGRRLPLAELASAGIECLAGKAALLVIQARLCPGGDELAVPYRGSQYMPAAHRLAENLATDGLLPGELRPLVRVRFHLLDHLKKLDTVVRLPEAIAGYFGRGEVPARQLGENYAALAAEAAQRLEAFKDDSARNKWQRDSFPRIFQAIDELEHRRRELATRNPKSAEIRQLGRQQKQLQTDLLKKLVEQISRDTHMAGIDHWDSRGALLPWCVALGGEGLYNEVISKAELYRETPDRTP